MPEKSKKRIFGTTERPRLVVFRSLRYMHGQIVDDSQKKVLLGLSDISKSVKDALKKAKSKKEKAFIVGKLLAEEAKKKNVSKVVFDRNSYLYHGRVKSFADGAREGGLDF
ncbi:MAG: 50S ribosomal protein L18 [Calditrichaceae bacterium]